MKNFFKGFFNKPISQEPETSNSVLLSAISLMIEVSLADEIMDFSELEIETGTQNEIWTWN